MMLAAQTTMTVMDIQNIPSWALALKMRRLERNLTQEELAAKTDGEVAQRTVSNLETARTHIKEVGLGRAMALADALDWTFLQFLANLGLTSEDFKSSSAAVQSPTLERSLLQAVKQFGGMFPELRDPKVQAELAERDFQRRIARTPEGWLKEYLEGKQIQDDIASIDALDD